MPPCLTEQNQTLKITPAPVNDRQPPQLIRETIKRAPTRAPQSTFVQPELWHQDLYSLDSRLQETDNKLRNEELRYAKFMARRHYLANVLPHHEFKQLVSQVSLSLVYYDPNFDFSSGQDPLSDRSDMYMGARSQHCPPPMSCSGQYEVRYQHPVHSTA